MLCFCIYFVYSYLYCYYLILFSDFVVLGIQRQADCIPANYFVELLKDNAQLIFVGM